MSKADVVLFQERIDELLLIEQRVDQRVAQFIALTQTQREAHQQQHAQWSAQLSEANDTFAQINEAACSMEQCITLCATHTRRSTQVFLGAVITSVLIVAGTLWWSSHIRSDLSDAKSTLASLTTQLKHQPVYLHYGDKDYVQVVPHSEVALSRQDDTLSGMYAQVQHTR